MESLRLLIRRGADPGIYVPLWGGCLSLAIYGSMVESSEGLRDAMILLIENGADVYARDSDGRSATDIANNSETKWLYDYKEHVNRDLRLKDIWTEALAACGYDPDEVINRSLQAVEVSDSDDDMNENEDDSDGEDEDEYDIGEAEDEENVITNQNDDSPKQTASAAQSHFDWSLLEGDTNIWTT